MNIKRFVLPTLVVAGFALGSAAANAATIDFDDLTSGADANTDATAAANGISFSGAELVQDVNADGDPLGTFTWTATSDPVFAVNSAAAGWGTAPSASNALDARFNAVMISLSSPGSIFFSATLDNSTLNGGNFSPAKMTSCSSTPPAASSIDSLPTSWRRAMLPPRPSTVSAALCWRRARSMTT